MIVNAQSSARRVASVPMPVPRRWPRKIPNSAAREVVVDVLEAADADQLAVGGVVDRERDRRWPGRAAPPRSRARTSVVSASSLTRPRWARPRRTSRVVEPRGEPRSCSRSQQTEGRALALTTQELMAGCSGASPAIMRSLRARMREVRIHDTLTRRACARSSRATRRAWASTPAGRPSTAACTSATRGPYVVFSLLKRFLEHEGYEATFVANITDVNDKIYDAARERGVPSERAGARDDATPTSPTPTRSGWAGPTTSPRRARRSRRSSR